MPGPDGGRAAGAGSGERSRVASPRRAAGRPVPMMEVALLWAGCGLFAASVGCDIRWRRIPNTIPVALLGSYWLYALLDGSGTFGGAWLHLGLGALLLAGGYALYLTGGFGAGDAKLMGVAGVWVGPGGLGIYLLGLAACAFVLCLVACLPLDGSRRLRRELPFAAAIAPPALAVLVPRAMAHGIST